MLCEPPYDIDKVAEQPLIEITQSAMQYFQDCPQKFAFRYMMLLATDGTTLPLMTGEAGHAAMRILLDGKGPPTIEKETAALIAIDEVFEKYLEDSLLLANVKDIRVGQAQAHSLVSLWTTCLPEFFDTWEVLDVEQTIRALPGATISSSLEDRMAGKLDAILLKKDTQEEYLGEHKFLASAYWLTDLDLDTQLIWYHLLAMRQGRALKGFIHNLMIKPQHRMNDQGIDDLIERMQSAIGAQPEKYFRPQVVDVNEDTLLLMHRNFSRTVHRMDFDMGAGLLTMHTNRCGDYGGCPYTHLCRNGADANDPKGVLAMAEVNLFTFQPVHQELKEEEDG